MNKSSIGKTSQLFISASYFAATLSDEVLKIAFNLSCTVDPGSLGACPGTLQPSPPGWLQGFKAADPPPPNAVVGVQQWPRLRWLSVPELGR